MARRRRGYRRGYPVAVLIGFDRDRAVMWRVFSQVVKTHSTVEAPRGSKRERYNFHEAVVNALRPILKEGVGSVVMVAPARTSFVKEFLDHVAKHQPWMTRGTGSATFTGIVGSATTQEEVGSRGATVTGFNINPWVTMNSDTTSVIAPGVSASIVGSIKLGEGPIICLGPAFSRSIWELMMEVAESKGIPYQRRGVPGRSGNDSWALQVARGGAFCGLLSMPNRYMHSPNEVVSLKDIKNTGKLFAATTKALEEVELKHTTQVFKKP